MKHLILEVKNGIGEGGFACGPVDGPVVCEVKLQLEDGTETYYCLAESMGIPNFYQTDKSTFQAQVDEEMDDELIGYMNDHYLDVGCDYSDIFESGYDNQDYDILRYLIYLVRCPQDKEKAFIERTVGKTIEEIVIPKTDVERGEVSYQQYKDLDAETRAAFLASLSDERADEILAALLDELSEDDNVTGKVYGADNCYFAISGGEIHEICDDAGYNPRGSWFPDIFTGLPKNVKARMTEIMEKLETIGSLEEMFGIITENIDIEFEDEDVIEMFEDGEDFDNLKLYKALMREVKKPAGMFKGADDFYAKMKRMDLEYGALYYEWEDEIIDLLENILDCGESQGTYDGMSSAEWIEALCHLEDNEVTACED